MARIKLADIAREAGVSNTTVSFYINGKAEKYKLAAETCQRIEDAIRKYNYVPNLHARAMHSGKTYLIGLCIPGPLISSFWNDIIDGIELEAGPQGYHLLLSTTHRTPREEREAIEFMRRKGVDGLLVHPVRAGEEAVNEAWFRELQAGCPLVALNRELTGVDSVFNDDRFGGASAAEALWNRGHRRMAYFDANGDFGHIRAKAFCERVLELGGEVYCFRDAAQLAAERGRITGIFSFCDHMLISLYGRISAAGGKIPQDFSLIGYDGLELTRLLTPPAATVVQFKRQLGKLAFQLLWKRISAEKTETIPAISLRLRPRLYTGCSLRKI